MAVGAILGAATAALFLVGITTGPEVAVGRAELPLAMTDVPSAGGLAAPPGGSTVTAVLSATISAPTTTVPPATTTRPSRTRRPPTKPPCFLFC